MAKKSESSFIVNYVKNINWRTVGIEIGVFILLFILFLFAAGAFY